MIGRLMAGLILVGTSSAALAQGASPVPIKDPGAALQPPSHIAGQYTWGRPSLRERAFVRFRAELRDLRQQALAWQAVDGGTLSAEHSAIIQARLDEAQADYRRSRAVTG